MLTAVRYTSSFSYLMSYALLLGNFFSSHERKLIFWPFVSMWFVRRRYELYINSFYYTLKPFCLAFLLSLACCCWWQLFILPCDNLIFWTKPRSSIPSSIQSVELNLSAMIWTEDRSEHSFHDQKAAGTSTKLETS